MRKETEANYPLSLRDCDQSQTQQDTDPTELRHQLQQFLGPPRPHLLDSHPCTEGDQLGGQKSLENFQGIYLLNPRIKTGIGSFAVRLCGLPATALSLKGTSPNRAKTCLYWTKLPLHFLTRGFGLSLNLLRLEAN